MNRPRIIHWLRVALTAICVMVCVLLVGFWVRSFSWRDVIFVRQISSDYAEVSSIRGQLVFGAIFYPTGNREPLEPGYAKWGIDSIPESTVLDPFPNVGQQRGALGFRIYDDGIHSGFGVPYWLPVVILTWLAIFGALPWIPTRFSLRALLIVTTLVAGDIVNCCG